MTKSYRKSAGFTVVEFLLVLLVVGVLAFVGYTFMNKQQAAQTADSTTTTSQSADDKSVTQSDTGSATDLQKAINVDTNENIDISAGGTTDEEN